MQTAASVTKLTNPLSTQMVALDSVSSRVQQLPEAERKCVDHLQPAKTAGSERIVASVIASPAIIRSSPQVSLYGAPAEMRAMTKTVRGRGTHSSV